MRVNLRARCAALAFLLCLPLAARAQIAAVDRAAGVPAGVTVPSLGAAAAEEPTAIGVNPAGLGFVGGGALQYVHEAQPDAHASGDGLYLAGALGPAHLGVAVEWLRPGEDPLPRYHRTSFALALSDGRAASLAASWTGVSGDLSGASSWALGATLRPAPVFSLGASVLGMGAELQGSHLPVRYDLGLATRLLDDRLTASADLLADDQGHAFRATNLALGAGVELGLGLVLSGTLQLPLRDDAQGHRTPSGLVNLTWNAAHAGLGAGMVSTPDRIGWLASARLSSERYRSAALGSGLARFDLPRTLEPDRFLWLVVGDPDPYGRLEERLVRARDDPEVAAVVVRIDSVPVGSGRVEELRALLAAIRARKPVLAYLTGGGTREYWLATAASAIAGAPGAPLMVNGLASAQLYVKDLLARLGVAVEVVRAGAYKSAAEPLVRTGASREAREELDALLDDVYGRFVADVAAARRLPPERVRALVDEGLFTSEQAREAGLLDEVAWPDELDAWASRAAGLPPRRSRAYAPEPERRAQRWGRPPVVEVIRLEGIIARGRVAPDGGLGPDVAGADAVAAAIRRAGEDDEVKAIVLRVESPGGDGFASDLIWREVVRARARGKPVVASMGDLAASGGYLAAAGADAIVAEASTLTGSIGVFAAKPDLSGLLDKLAVRRESSARGAHAELTSINRPWSEGERATVQKQIDAFYALFVGRVAEGRHLGRAEVEAVAQGRVWTGRQALERHLVDRLGTLADAVALAREKAGLDPREPALLRRSGAGEGTLYRALSSTLAAAAPEPPLARLAGAIPELPVLLLLSSGDLGPVLALPEAWLGGKE
jgi:protease-4